MLQRSVENQGLAGDERVLDSQPRDQARDFLDASEPATEQGLRDLLVTDMKHPIFGNA